MNRLLFAALLAMSSAFTAHAEVSVTIGQPGFYGRIDIGGFPQPKLIFPQPVIIVPAPSHHAPVYLHVPPGHAKDWDKHCRHYNACGEPVYFVQDDWYEHEYVPRYQEYHGRHPDNDNRNDQHDFDRDDRNREYKHKFEHKKHQGKHKNRHENNGRHSNHKQNGHNWGGNKHGGHGRGH